MLWNYWVALGLFLLLAAFIGSIVLHDICTCYGHQEWEWERLKGKNRKEKPKKKFEVYPGHDDLI